jgi:Zn-dependent protease/CBS domain-containing protein
MKGFQIGRLFGIPIRLDLTFLLVLPLFAYVIGSQIGTWGGIFNDLVGASVDVSALTGAPAVAYTVGTATAVGLFASVLLHELGHSLVARRYDVEIQSITLWLFGGVAQLGEFPEDWRKELYIAVAGPVVSVLLGVGLFVGFGFVPGGNTLLVAAQFAVGYLALTNVALAAFNMLPGFPMDGGRVLRALLARDRPYARATQIAATVGKGFAILLGLFALFGGAGINLYLVALAFFIYIGAASEAQQTMMRAAFEGVQVRDIMTPGEDVKTVDAGASVADLLERMFAERHTGYPVTRNGEVVGLVTLEDAQGVRAVERDAYAVEEVMSTDLQTIEPGADAMDAMERMQEAGVGRLLVMDGDDLAGLISRTDLMTALDIIRETGSVSPRSRPAESPERRPDF